MNIYELISFKLKKKQKKTTTPFQKKIIIILFLSDFENPKTKKVYPKHFCYTLTCKKYYPNH